MVFPFGIGCDDDTPARGRLSARLIALATVAQRMRPFHSVSLRKYQVGSYEEMRATHRWDVPERYNIARDVCDKHTRDRLAMVWEDWQGNERRVTFGELRSSPTGSPTCSTRSVSSAATRGHPVALAARDGGGLPGH